MGNRRINGDKGTFIIDGTSANTNLDYEVIIPVEDTIIALCTGLDNAGEAVDFLATQNWNGTLTSAHGSLLKHITLNANPETFQPMNINFGLMPDINIKKSDTTKKIKHIKGRDKKRIQAIEALKSFNKWYQNINYN